MTVSFERLAITTSCAEPFCPRAMNDFRARRGGGCRPAERHWRPNSAIAAGWSIMPDTDSWQLRDGEQVIAGNAGLLGRRHFLIGITRVRNEALVLRDTLDYVGKQVDAIVAYDDASTDRTLEILREHPKVALIVANRSWETDIEARRIAEGRHRGLAAADGARTSAVRLDVLLRCGRARDRRSAQLHGRNAFQRLRRRAGSNCSTPI